MKLWATYNVMQTPKKRRYGFNKKRWFFHIGAFCFSIRWMP